MRLSLHEKSIQRFGQVQNCWCGVDIMGIPIIMMLLNTTLLQVNGSSISSNGAPTARRNHTAVWTGNQMIIWGGYDGNNVFNDGARYNPSSKYFSNVTSHRMEDSTEIITLQYGRVSEMIIWECGS